MHQATGHISSVFEVSEGILSGRVARSLVHRTNKKEAITAALITHSRERSMAFGGSESDADM
jgi:phosphoserine phosphatase